MTISVVVATYNRAALLHDALIRLRDQQYEAGDEVIVVDNACTDATPEVIARVAHEFPVPLHRLCEAMPGKSAALNAGLAAARGDILAVTDDDVWVDANWIATMREIFRNPSTALVGGRVDPRWERKAPRWLRVEDAGAYGPMSSPLALLHYGEAQELGVRTALGSNMIIRRSVLDALGGFDPSLSRRPGTLLGGEDHEFCQRAVAAGYRCEYRPELRVQHWVPAERTRLRYYVRWFFWSGITEAMLDSTHPTGSRARATVGGASLSPTATCRAILRGLAAAARRSREGGGRRNGCRARSRLPHDANQGPPTR